MHSTVKRSSVPDGVRVVIMPHQQPECGLFVAGKRAVGLRRRGLLAASVGTNAFDSKEVVMIVGFVGWALLFVIVLVALAIIGAISLIRRVV
jgi:hypothetical protein